MYVALRKSIHFREIFEWAFTDGVTTFVNIWLCCRQALIFWLKNFDYFTVWCLLLLCHLKRKLFKSTIMPVEVLISIVKDWYEWLVSGLVHLLSNDTWIEPMVVINSQPWGIVYWLVFKRLPVQTTYLFLQAFFEVLLFTRNANNVGNQVQITLNIDIISPIRNDYDVLWRKLWSKWVELVSVKQCTCLFTNTLKMITRQSDGESLAWYRSAAGIIFNSSLFEYFSIQQIMPIYI